MTNIVLPIEQHVDIETLNVYRERLEQGYAEEDVMKSIRARSRDNARTPMQWNADANAGFTTGTPWVPVNPNYTQINAEAALADPNSVFHHYRKLVELRKNYEVFRSGSFTLLCPEDEKIFAYTRDTETEHLLVVCNFTGKEQPFSIPEGYEAAEVLISNYPDRVSDLRPYEAYMLCRK